MQAYQITYEVLDGTVETYTTHTRFRDAVRIARHCSHSSALNRPLFVTRWFVEWEGQTLETFDVTAH